MAVLELCRFVLVERAYITLRFIVLCVGCFLRTCFTLYIHSSTLQIRSRQTSKSEVYLLGVAEFNIGEVNIRNLIFYSSKSP